MRTRLVRRAGYRLWKSFLLNKAKSLIQKVKYEQEDRSFWMMPAIILSSYSRLSDFLILSYLFREKELTLILPDHLPSDRLINVLRATNHLVRLGTRGVGYSFFREILKVLRNYNRSIVISPDAARMYMPEMPIDPRVIVRIAMMANVPIVPVVMRWSRSSMKASKGQDECEIWIRKKIFISPQNQEFSDIFFKAHGVRKFRKLAPEDFSAIGNRIFSKILSSNGSNLQ